MIKSEIIKLAGQIARMGRRGTRLSFWWEGQKERDHWEDQDRRVDNIEIDLREVWSGDVDWTGLVQDRYQWWDLVDSVMNVWVP
jgi:hypothetical protein